MVRWMCYQGDHNYPRVTTMVRWMCYQGDHNYPRVTTMVRWMCYQGDHNYPRVTTMVRWMCYQGDHNYPRVTTMVRWMCYQGDHNARYRNMATFSWYDAHFSDILQICWFACKFFATAPFRRRRICCYLLHPFEGDVSAAIYCTHTSAVFSEQARHRIDEYNGKQVVKQNSLVQQKRFVSVKFSLVIFCITCTESDVLGAYNYTQKLVH